MELLIRGLICAICLLAYNRILLDKEIRNKLELRVEMPFVGLTAFALQIITHSVVYRVSNYLGISTLLQEVFVVVGVFFEYAVLCMLITKLIKDNLPKCMCYMASLSFTIGIGLVVICGHITREWYVIVYLLSFVISFVLSVKRADKISISGNNVWKNRLKFSFPVALFTGFTFYIYLPSEVYLGNPEAFFVEYWKFIRPLFIDFLLFFSVYLLATLFCVTKKHYYACNIFCTIFVLMSNVQNMLLNGKLKSLDGVMQEWDTMTIVFNCALWLIAFAVCFGFSIKNKKAIRNVFKITGYLGVLIQVISLGILLLITLPTIKIDKYILSTENYFEVSAKDNVFVFVLDWFDTQIMEAIINENENFLEPLDGFTHYTNTTSKYAFTDMSLVYLLTGEEWEYPQLESEYALTAHENSDFLEKISEEGYSIGVYTEDSYIGKAEKNLVENGKFVEWSLRKDDQRYLMEKAGRYKTSPFLFKERFFYTDEEIGGMIDIEGDVDIHDLNKDIEFAETLLEEGITVNENKDGTFKVYHLHGAHGPYNMNEQFERADTNMIAQSKGSMKIVYAFIEQLKAKGVYENSTIIITADHGQNYFDRPKKVEEMGLDLVSSPILFVKARGSHGTKIQISTAPVSHEEVVPTILKTITGDTLGYGRTFDEVDEEERTREFIYGRHDDIPFVRYEIKGNVMDLESWSKPVSFESLSDSNYE